MGGYTNAHPCGREHQGQYNYQNGKLWFLPVCILAKSQTSEIPYLDMKTGTWQIVINLESTEVKRTFTLTVGAPETVVITASCPFASYADIADRHEKQITPTVIIGTTSIPPASSK